MEEGLVFRVDLRLRPEGSKGNLSNSLRSAEIYYESWGRPWERAALLKARPVAGNKALGECFLEIVQPFIYRKYLDYTMIEEIREMKEEILKLIEKWVEQCVDDMTSMEVNDNQECARILRVNMKNGLEKEINLTGEEK